MKKLIILSLALAIAWAVGAQTQDWYTINPTEPDHLKPTTVAPIQSGPNPDLCVNLGRYLRLGMSGTDVSNLQRYLEARGYYVHPQGVAYGYFGRLTLAGVIRFQESNATEILYPNGLTRGNGYVGPSTIAKMRCNVSQGGGPVINSVSGPTALKVGESGTWTIKAYDPSGGRLTYNVDWGERFPGTATAPRSEIGYQTATLTHYYASPGTYVVSFVVTNSFGKQTSSTLTVRVSSNSTTSIRVISPNGGEVWRLGEQRIIERSGVVGPVDIRLRTYIACLDSNVAPCLIAEPGPRTIVSNFSGLQYNWTVGNIDTSNWPPNAGAPAPIYPGQYKIEVCYTGTSICDKSDGPFTITDNRSIRVISPNGGENWIDRTIQPLRWAATNYQSTDKVDIYLDSTLYYTPPCPPGYGCAQVMMNNKYELDKNIGINSVYNWIVGTDIVNRPIPAGGYKLRVCISGTDICDVSDQAFKIIPQPVSLP